MLQDELFPKPLIALSFKTLVIISKFLVIAVLNFIKLIELLIFLTPMLVVITKVSVRYLLVAVTSLKLVV
jgi:hypothetical protein